MARVARQPRRPATRSGVTPRAQPGSKRDRILEVATDYFGRYGYEETKWADVAVAVGIGSTALYHYFESKQHCLFEVMAGAIASSRERFDRIVAVHADWNEALVAVLAAGFELTDRDVLQYRVLVAAHGRLGKPRAPSREEAARRRVLTLKREYDRAWAAFLMRGMDEAALPRNDPQLLARAVVGLYNSVWTWYRPGGALSLAEVGRFFGSRVLAMIGCDEQAPQEPSSRS